MKAFPRTAFSFGLLVFTAFLLDSAAAAAAGPAGPLEGAWTLVAADVVRADGTRTHDYGDAPKGLLLIAADGRYSLQIFSSDRPRFAAGDKAKGTPEEFRGAALGSSTHYGRASVDAAAGVLTLDIEGASFPNWEGTQQKRQYELKGDELSYRVPPRPDGGVPISVWKRVR